MHKNPTEAQRGMPCKNCGSKTRVIKDPNSTNEALECTNRDCSQRIAFLEVGGSDNPGRKPSRDELKPADLSLRFPVSYSRMIQPWQVYIQPGDYGNIYTVVVKNKETLVKDVVQIPSRYYTEGKARALADAMIKHAEA